MQVDEGFEEDGFVLPDLLAGSADVGASHIVAVVRDRKNDAHVRQHALI